MKKSAKEISEAFEFVSDVCYSIKEVDGCDECPMMHLCLESGEESVIGIADLVSVSAWQEFIDYEDEAKSNFSIANAADNYADWQRKFDIEERM